MADSNSPEHDHSQYGISLIEELSAMEATPEEEPDAGPGRGAVVMDRLREWRPGKLLVGTATLFVIISVVWGASRIILGHNPNTNNPPNTTTNTYDNNATNPVDILNKDTHKSTPKKSTTDKPKPKPTPNPSPQPSTSPTPPAPAKKTVPVPDPTLSDPGGNPLQP